jgi:hypothetical protein
LRGKAATNRAAELVQNPTSQMIDAAQEQAELQTYTERPDRIMSWFLAGRKIPGMNYLLPFVQIPYNITKNAVRYSPFGFNPKKTKTPEASRMLARMMVGSLFMGAMAYPWKKHELTGAAPKSPAERDEFSRSGKQPFSIKVGNRWYSYLALSHLGLLASGVASIADKWKKEWRPDPAQAVEQFAFYGTRCSKSLFFAA